MAADGQRQPALHLAADVHGLHRVLRFQHRRVGSDGHRLLQVADLQGQVNRQVQPGADDDASSRHFREPL
jgi:hypothetical protein